MAINFEAANMAGYNNPEVRVFPVTVQMGSNGLIVVGAPSYSTITNIIKSGYLPSLYVTLPTGDNAILPLTAIDKEEVYQFSAAIYTAPTAPQNSKSLISIIYGSTFEHPLLKTESLG